MLIIQVLRSGNYRKHPGVGTEKMEESKKDGYRTQQGQSKSTRYKVPAVQLDCSITAATMMVMPASIAYRSV